MLAAERLYPSRFGLREPASQVAKLIIFLEAVSSPNNGRNGGALVSRKNRASHLKQLLCALTDEPQGTPNFHRVGGRKIWREIPSPGDFSLHILRTISGSFGFIKNLAHFISDDIS
ncbi:hypothetical protein TNIN_204961 [Trichonephila inaurata madagascariensis]|uniref:Uncharacterized protein n=1 Tax=Trichonephila inaurata madagascariensis TaxID=2747483 RepID=A0A8X6YRQ2_9ARAC|nr:hypothetical protein TNIN_204961 [Trichonephila inaurata madagascariensis]